jgi:hypothetical protein
MNIIKWYKRVFRILTIEECKELGLVHSHNIYGDSINHLNCRSIWKDEKDRTYRCESLIPTIGVLDLWILKMKNQDKVQPITQEEYNKIRDEEFERLKTLYSP